MAAHGRRERVVAEAGGAITGFFAGGVMMTAAALISVLRGQDLWLALKVAAVPFLGDRALSPGLDTQALAIGLVAHFAVAAAWGVAFGLVVGGLGRRFTILLGAVWGVGVWLVMYYVVLPLMGAQAVLALTLPGWAVVEHLLFGLALGFGYLRFQEPHHRPPSRHRERAASAGS